MPGRFNPVRTMSYVNVPLSDDPEWICANEDVVVMPLQCATHWDGLAHVSYRGTLYNGYPATAVNSAGASRLGIHLVDSLVSRGVLLDVARAKETRRPRRRVRHHARRTSTRPARSPG